MAQASKPGWTWAWSIALAIGLAVTIVAALTGAWVLTALPLGLLFGFFLERSDLCGSSAMSEVVLMRDGRKLYGLWVAIVVSMLLFALGDGLGLIRLNPKPLFWANILIGGAAFGVGIVLAGGCISGVLFKAGQGNLNSMAALGGGCVVGHILSGVALLSLGSILFFVVVLAANWITTRLYMMGR